VVHGVVGWTDFDAVDGVARIEALAARNLLVGLRPMVQDIADDDWLPRPALAPLLAAMARNGRVFDALVLPRHLPRHLRVIGRHLDLQFVLDHCGKPPLATGEIADWQRDIALLAEHPNIVCKLSGLVTEAAPDRSSIWRGTQNDSPPPKPCWLIYHRTRRRIFAAATRRASISHAGADRQVDDDPICPRPWSIR
jgi:predicted TIM-barrel fold metal-dependent hydrolase